MKKDLNNLLDIKDCDEMISDSKKLGFEDLTSKWSLRIADDLVVRFIA